MIAKILFLILYKKLICIIKIITIIQLMIIFLFYFIEEKQVQKFY